MDQVDLSVCTPVIHEGSNSVLWRCKINSLTKVNKCVASYEKEEPVSKGDDARNSPVRDYDANNKPRLYIMFMELDT